MTSALTHLKWTKWKKLWLAKPHSRALVALITIVILYVTINVPILIVPQHFSYNLEPYPDGILYSLIARNVAMGRGLQLVYQDVTLAPWVPPMYSLVLVAGYFINSHPIFFVLTNILLGLGNLSLIFWAVFKRTRNLAAGVVAAVTLLSFGHFVWLASVPMSENLALFFMAVSIYFLLNRLFTPRSTILLLVSAGGLVLCRYATVFSAATIGLLASLELYAKQQTRKWLVMAGGIGLVMVLAGLIAIGINPWALAVSVWHQLIQTNDSNNFFSVGYVFPNIVFYGRALLGLPSRFLWLDFPMVSWPIWVVIGAGIYRSWNQKTNRWNWTVLGSLLLSQLVLPLVFYSQDTRYIVLVLPLLAVAVGLSFHQLSKNLKKKWLWALITIVLLFQLVTQLSFFRQIIAANLLGRSTAWQYEAIIFLNSQVPAGSYLITALPPYLVDAYGGTDYQTLPLSHQQEFAQKGNQVWSRLLAFDDLTSEYDRLLSQGEMVFISNAYITHQAEVVAQFEELQRLYALELVQEGCLQTCNLYRITKSNFQNKPK